MTSYATQNSLLLDKLMEYYTVDNNLDKILSIINGESFIKLRKEPLQTFNSVSALLKDRIST